MENNKRIIGEIVMTVLNRRSGITLEEYGDKQCCYSCANCRKPNADGRGVCSISDSKVYIYHTNKCCSYSDAELVMCEECEMYFRSLTLHVKKHGMTIKEYKEKHGYNRNTPMTCVTTSELHREHGLKNMCIHGQYEKPDNRGKTWSVRAEGLLNQEKELNRRGGYIFMKNMNKKATAITKGSQIPEERKERISLSNTGKTRTIAQNNRRLKSFNMTIGNRLQEG